jgi:signal transduction histidine kinase
MALHKETGIVAAGEPGGALGRRSVLLPALLLIAGMVALGAALWGRPLRDCFLPVTGACALANGLSALAAFARALETPQERRGWSLLGTSLILLTVANLAAGIGRLLPGHSPIGTSAPLVLGATSLGLATAGLLLFPWRSTGLRIRGRNVPGSFLFVGSILVILLPFTDWSAGFGSHPVVNLALLAACGRLVLLGGITLMLLEQDPRRVRGVLGFVLLNVLLGIIYITLLQHVLVRNWSPALPLVSVYALSPLILGLAAWSRAPLELPALPLRGGRTWELVPYATFAAAAAGLLLRFLAEGKLGKASLIGFILLTFLLLFRQFLLLSDLRLQNHSLDRRVQERTRDLEAIQAAVLRTERLNTLSTLGAGIAHDLNNFLGVVHTSVQLIEEHPEGVPPALGPHFSRIRASCERAVALTKRLLRFARKDAEPPMVLDLAWELGLQEELLRMLLPRGIALHLEVAPGAFPVLSRKSHLEQILVNLVCNAKDALTEGGTVTIRLDAPEEGPGVRVRVEDDGPGMPDEVLEHLFEFFITTKGEGKGTGLGLPTVKFLVEADGGTLSVVSRPGEGCSFLILYPLAEA